MGVVETRCDAAEVLDGHRLIELGPAQTVGQAAARDVLHDHVRRSLVFAEVEDVEDVRVAHLGDRLRLMAEARDRVLVRRNRLHDLDGAGARELGVIGAVDDAHGALAYEVLDFILTQLGSGSDRHGH